jgi:hypothetical protein
MARHRTYPIAFNRPAAHGISYTPTCHRAEAGSLVGAVEHFLKVARSYRPGLFRCYAVAGLPRTNNDLEQMFGSQRYHERRATGRKTASPDRIGLACHLGLQKRGLDIQGSHHALPHTLFRCLL